MNTGTKRELIPKNSRTRQVVISQSDHVGSSPQLLPEKHPLEDNCHLHLQRKVQKRRKLNENSFAPKIFCPQLDLQQLQNHTQTAQYDLGSSPANILLEQLRWSQKMALVNHLVPAQQLPQESQFYVPRPFTPPLEVPHQQAVTMNQVVLPSESVEKTSHNQSCVTTRQQSSTDNKFTNAFNSDPSMVTDHPDAPENDNQEFSILNIIPSLISEKNRKAAFVENLVDAAVLIIDLIWANFKVSPRAKIITLRVFLQETLRRSRTSYSTLQTALFYLFRIKSKIASLSRASPGFPLTPTSEYPPDLNQSQNNDPATCGRRMFLAALIVASKYLQDRNYSNRAWSKISGLPVNEINANEICFLKLIDYNLFISEDIFKRWSSLLLTHIQAISGSEISSPDAFRRKENQREVDKFKETLKYIDSKSMDCKRVITYPVTPAVSAPGSPREQQTDVMHAPTFPTFQRLRSGQRIADKESRRKSVLDSDQHDCKSIISPPQATHVFTLQAPPSQLHILPTIVQQPGATQLNLNRLQVICDQSKKENPVSSSSSFIYFQNSSYSLPRSKSRNKSKNIEGASSQPSASRLLSEPTELTKNVNIPVIQNNCSEAAFEGCQNNQILLRSSA